jgi:hypothetical protein
LGLSGGPAVLALEAVRAPSPRRCPRLLSSSPGVSTNGGRPRCPFLPTPERPEGTVCKEVPLDDTAGYCLSWWQVPSNRARVLARLGVPVVSFRDALWPSVSSSPPDRPVSILTGFRSTRSFLTGSRAPHVHFPSQAHQLIACTLAHSLMRAAAQLEAAAAAGSKVPAEEEAVSAAAAAATAAAQAANAHDALRRCEAPVTRLQPPLASFSAASQPGKWQFGEDVAGKPGWQGADTTPSSLHNVLKFGVLSNHIDFKVRLGTMRRVIISRLRSYDPSMGRAHVLLLPPHTEAGDSAAKYRAAQEHGVSWIVDSHWLEPISVPEHHVHTITDVEWRTLHNGSGSGAGQGAYTLRLQVLRNDWRRGIHGVPRVHAARIRDALRRHQILADIPRSTPHAWQMRRPVEPLLPLDKCELEESLQAVGGYDLLKRPAPPCVHKCCLCCLCNKLARH